MTPTRGKRCQRGLWLHGILLAAVLQAGCGASLNDEGVAALGSTAGINAAGEPQSAAAIAAAPGPVAAPPAQAGGATPAGGAPAPHQAMAAGAPAPGNTGYKIGPQDVLDISVFKVPELSKTVQVSDAGTVNLPLVGEIQASGRTSQAIERELTQKLGDKYLQSPQVTVSVKEFNSQRITIDGAVTKPGVFPYRSAVSLLQVITMAGGLDKNSDATVVVFRTINGERKGARFDVDQIREGQAPDPAIEPGDIVVVGTSAIKEAFNNVLRVLPSAGLFMGL